MTVVIASAPHQVAGDWTEHAGGNSPVEAGAVVDVRFRDGGEAYGLLALQHTSRWRDAEGRFWRHEDHHSDIVAYRVVRP